MINGWNYLKNIIRELGGTSLRMPGVSRDIELRQEILNAYKKYGFAYFAMGAHNLNVIAIRNDIDPQPNTFDDVLLVLNDNPRLEVSAWACTTEPGRYWLSHPFSAAAKSGAAVIDCPQQMRGAYMLSYHSQGHEALVQHKNIWIRRDDNWNGTPETEGMARAHGLYYCNVHGSWGQEEVHNQSAGCIVLKDRFDSPNYKRFIATLNRSSKLYGQLFTVTLIKSSDI